MTESAPSADRCSNGVNLMGWGPGKGSQTESPDLTRPPGRRLDSKTKGLAREVPHEVNLRILKKTLRLYVPMLKISAFLLSSSQLTLRQASQQYFLACKTRGTDASGNTPGDASGGVRFRRRFRRRPLTRSRRHSRAALADAPETLLGTLSGRAPPRL